MEKNTDERREASRDFKAISSTSCAKEDEEPNHARSRAPRDAKVVRKKSSKSTKAEVDDDRNDKKRSLR